MMGLMNIGSLTSSQGKVSPFEAMGMVCSLVKSTTSSVRFGPGQSVIQEIHY